MAPPECRCLRRGGESQAERHPRISRRFRRSEPKRPPVFRRFPVCRKVVIAPGETTWRAWSGRLSETGRAPIVQRPRTPPFQGGNAGSNPVGSTQYTASDDNRIPARVADIGLEAGTQQGPVAQLVSAPPCHGGGRGFKSRQGRSEEAGSSHDEPASFVSVEALRIDGVCRRVFAAGWWLLGGVTGVSFVAARPRCTPRHGPSVRSRATGPAARPVARMR